MYEHEMVWVREGHVCRDVEEAPRDVDTRLQLIPKTGWMCRLEYSKQKILLDGKSQIYRNEVTN
jgi:hypothetical protein